MRNRPTADLVVIFLTAIIGFLLLSTGMVALFLKLTGADQSTDDLFAFEGAVIKGSLALIIGYMAGRGVSGGMK